MHSFFQLAPLASSEQQHKELALFEEQNWTLESKLNS